MRVADNVDDPGIVEDVNCIPALIAACSRCNCCKFCSSNCELCIKGGVGSEEGGTAILGRASDDGVCLEFCGGMDCTGWAVEDGARMGGCG